MLLFWHVLHLLLNAKDMLRCGQNQGFPSARAKNALGLDFVPRSACCGR